MLGHKHFYNATTRKVIAIFGSLFNDLYIAKRNTDGSNEFQRVPLTYAPKDRYLLRINEDNSQIAVKLPRMCFEINDMSMNKAVGINKMHNTRRTTNGRLFTSPRAVTYSFTLDLSIMSRSQDECLQIVEQIIPFFSPTFTLTANDLDGEGTKTDMPITLTSVSHEDSYEGDLASSTRMVVYTLSFALNAKFGGPGADITDKLIKAIEISFNDEESENIEIRTQFLSDTEQDHTVVTTFGANLDPNRDIWDDE